MSLQDFNGGETFKILLDFLNFGPYVPNEKLGEMDSSGRFKQIDLCGVSAFSITVSGTQSCTPEPGVGPQSEC